VDRVCLAYIDHYRSRAQAVIQRGGVCRILSARASAELFDLLLKGGAGFRARLAGRAARLLPDLLLPERGRGRYYLNVGHTGLEQPGFAEWVQRADIKPIYMVHDLIPITHPQYARPGESVRHARRMTTVAKTATGIITNSQATLDVLAHWVEALQLPMPAARVAWLGTQPLSREETTPPIEGAYFVTLGTIEGRKNHLMLLQIWRELAQQSRGPIPRLVIIGQRGWAAEQAFALLDRCPVLEGHVIERSNCDDHELARYLQHARALLFPSFVEGYGLPLMEALVQGTPVIASDLPVFRELAGGAPAYCSPHDACGWRETILAYADSKDDARIARHARASAYQAPQWASHFEQIDEWLAALDRESD
jgi:glycosyltransferase involved in cell wall biosynthesis